MNPVFPFPPLTAPILHRHFMVVSSQRPPDAAVPSSSCQGKEKTATLVDSASRAGRSAHVCRSVECWYGPDVIHPSAPPHDVDAPPAPPKSLASPKTDARSRGWCCAGPATTTRRWASPRAPRRVSRCWLATTAAATRSRRLPFGAWCAGPCSANRSRCRRGARGS